MACLTILLLVLNIILWYIGISSCLYVKVLHGMNTKYFLPCTYIFRPILFLVLYAYYSLPTFLYIQAVCDLRKQAINSVILFYSSGKRWLVNKKQLGSRVHGSRSLVCHISHVHGSRVAVPPNFWLKLLKFPLILDVFSFELQLGRSWNVLETFLCTYVHCYPLRVHVSY